MLISMNPLYVYKIYAIANKIKLYRRKIYGETEYV